MRKKISGIYKIFNIINNHFYIGSTLDIHRRWLQHKRNLKNNIHYNTHLQRAWNKYGENNFDFIIEKDMSFSNLKEILNEEQKLLDIYFRKEYCYNTSKSANRSDGEYNPFYGKSHTNKTIKIISEKIKHKNMKNFLGKHHTSISLEKMKISKIGKYKGENNPRFDKNIYKFKNIKINEIFTGTRYQFYTKYNLNRGDIASLINKKK